MTTVKNAGDVVLAAAPDTLADAMVVTRNMNSRTESHPCTCVNCTFGRDMLKTKHNLAGDLASHMFGHLVSTEVARHILTTFVIDGVVQVFQGVIPHNEQPSEAPFDPHSEDVQRALAQAFKAATAHDCIRLHPEDNAPEKYSPPAEQEKEEKTYTFRWRIFPKEPYSPDELVSFLNEVTDRAFASVRLHPGTTKLELRHRFAAPEDDRHFVPLTYNPDQESIRAPDFILLPIQAFSGGGFETLDKRYLNFSAARLVGESNEHLGAGLDQMQWYAQGLKYAQPWVYYVLGMTISRPQDVVVFSRVDPSDWEHLSLMLWDGRGCIELIRILLGLALADGVDLGQNPDIQLICVERTFELVSSDAASSTADSQLDAASSYDDMSTTSDASSRDSAPASPFQNAVEKRHHSEVEMEDDGEEDPQSKKHKLLGAM